MNTLTPVEPSVELGNMVKSNLHEFFKIFSRCRMVDMVVTHNWIRWNTPVAHPWFKGMLCVNPTTCMDAHLVQDTIHYFSTHHAQNFTWWFSPELPAQTWKPLLESFGLCFDDSIPGMAVELSAIKHKQKSLADFKLQIVEDEDTLKVWVKTFVEGYRLPSTETPGLYQLLHGMGLDLPLRYYLGYWQGKPVASSSLFLIDDTAGVYYVATIPQARGHGFGTALTLAPLLDAKNLGSQVGILQSSDAGFPIYQRLGFRQVCSMEYFYWSVDKPM
jgi:ribosomal protein S18 acetylase RimI-like enzyme